MVVPRHNAYPAATKAAALSSSSAGGTRVSEATLNRCLLALGVTFPKAYCRGELGVSVCPAARAVPFFDQVGLCRPLLPLAGRDRLIRLPRRRGRGSSAGR